MWQRRRIGMAAGLGLALLALSLWGTFRGGTAAELLPEEKPAAVLLAGASGQKKQAAQPEAERPVLKGVLILGDDRRAMLACGGQTLTVKKGEQVGQWTVSDIEERQVVLSGAAGQAVLTL